MNSRVLKRIVAIILVTAMIMGFVPADTISNAEDYSGRVHVVIENTTYAEGAWSGTLVDTWVTIDSNSTMMNTVVKALNEKGYTQQGAESNYITEVNGLSAYDGGESSGWMVTLNDWFTNEGAGSYTVALGTLEEGDEIRVSYSLNWGADLGSDWSSNDKTLKGITAGTGTFDTDFSSTDREYILTVSENTEKLTIIPTANNKNFQVRTYVGDTVYKRTAEIPVSDGTEIIIKCGDPSWPSMNQTDTDAEIYKITVKKEGTQIIPPEFESLNFLKSALSNWSDDTFSSDTYEYNLQIKNYSTSTLTLTGGTVYDTDKYTAYAEYTDINGIKQNIGINSSKITYLQNIPFGNTKLTITVADKTNDTNKTVYTFNINRPYDTTQGDDSYENDMEAVYNIYTKVGEKLSSQNVPGVGTSNGEWQILGLARAGKLSDTYREGYIANVEKYVQENGSAKLSSSKSTENSRVIIALTALNYDVTNVKGYNLLEPLSDFTYVKRQGINGAIYALIAFDTADYEIPEAEEGMVQTTREGLVDYILGRQLEDGGWNLSQSSKISDLDMTAIAIQSLAPYYDNDEKVKNAVTKALNYISENQKDNGSVAVNSSQANSETQAQVIVAITELGIDPMSDGRFIKNGNTLLDALTLFYLEEGEGFRHFLGGSYNQMSTEQAYYALTAYYRFADGQTSLFDMSDVISNENESSDNTENNTDSNTENSTTDSTDSITDIQAGVEAGTESENTSVKTGDDAGITLYASLLIAALSGMAVIKRKSKKGEQQ